MFPRHFNNAIIIANACVKESGDGGILGKRSQRIALKNLKVPEYWGASVVQSDDVVPYSDP